MISVGRFWRTVRHLKAQQVIGRVRFTLLRPWPDARPPPRQRERHGAWVVPAMREHSLLSASRVRLLNVERDLDPGGWDDPAVDKLWRYNLHYFDDLTAHDAHERLPLQRAFLERWVRDNPAARGTGWEPYPTSLRIVNWIKWWVGGTAPEPSWLHSLAVQSRWLRRRLEIHLLGNHLFANAKALVYAGLFFEGREADEWLQKGRAVLERELPEQILADGGQFERSPMYHALALEDVLDLLNVIAAYGPAAASLRTLESSLREQAPKMLHWLRCMTHADGSPGAFNDAAAGVAPHLREIERYAAQLGVVSANSPQGLTHLAQSGYVRLARGAAVALLDVAPVGPDYLPGHAHADTLSFELSLRDRRVVVNGGTSCYGISAERLRQRGTAAHSTVQVARADSSEVWSGFRVGRRARPRSLVIEPWHVCCSHDGYTFLAGRPEHRRCWQLGTAELVVDDEVTADLPAVARYLLAPGLSLRQASARSFQVLRAEHDCVADVEIIQGCGARAGSRHAPRFGVLLTVECLEVTLVEGRARTRWTWPEHAHPVSH
jgi:hypothetical protein